MKSNRLLLLPLAMAAIHATSPVSAQQTDELDITITVMEEGETPEGLINRIELPPPEALSGAQTEPVTPPVDAVDDEVSGASVDNIVDIAEEASQVAEDATDSADDASQVATDRIRETISIDGTDDVVDNLTPPVQDVVDPELPLQDGIELPDPAGDAIGGVGDQVDDATDGVTDTVDDVSDDTTDEVTDTVDDVSDDATDDVSDTTDDVVDNIDDTTDDTTDIVDDTVDDASDTVDQTTSPLQTDDVTDELPDEEIEEETGDDVLDDVTGGGAGL